MHRQEKQMKAAEREKVEAEGELLISLWLLALAPRSSGLQELNFPGTGVSITWG